MTLWILKDWQKSFGKTAALKGISLTLEHNKIYGLVGPNGSGKSTLIKALSGTIKLDSGSLFKDHEEINIKSPTDAYRNGICAAHQELTLIPDLTVKENLLISARMKSQIDGFNLSRVFRNYLDLLSFWRSRSILEVPVKRLSRADQQVVELVKALGFQPRLLLLDEPTSFLADADIAILFSLIKDIREKSTVVFVSHRIREVLQISDEIIILKDGKNVAQFDTKKIDVDEIMKLIAAGRKISSNIKTKTDIEMRPPVPSYFTVKIKAPKVHNIHIELAKGEIVGIAGLVGHGQSELLRAIVGLVKSEKKDIRLEGKSLAIKKPVDAVKAGIVYISGNLADTVLPPRSVRENIALLVNAQKSPARFFIKKEETKVANEMIAKLNIVCRSPSEPVRVLSGGNQQKTVIARVLVAKPRVLLLDDPLKGIDTATKAQFQDLILEISKDSAVLFFSSDIDELLPIASRIVVMYEGRVVREFSGDDMTRENILTASMKGE